MRTSFNLISYRKFMSIAFAFSLVVGVVPSAKAASALLPFDINVRVLDTILLSNNLHPEALAKLQLFASHQSKIKAVYLIERFEFFRISEILDRLVKLREYTGKIKTNNWPFAQIGQIGLAMEEIRKLYNETLKAMFIETISPTDLFPVDSYEIKKLVPYLQTGRSTESNIELAKYTLQSFFEKYREKTETIVFTKGTRDGDWLVLLKIVNSLVHESIFL